MNLNERFAVRILTGRDSILVQNKFMALNIYWGLNDSPHILYLDTLNNTGLAIGFLPGVVTGRRGCLSQSYIDYFENKGVPIHSAEEFLEHQFEGQAMIITPERRAV